MTAVRRILILLFWTLSEAAVAASGRGASVAELDALNRAELDALVRGDYAAAAGFYAGDAILLPPDGTVVRGRSAIETYWRALEGSTLSEVRTRVLSGGADGETAFLAGEYAMTVRKPGAAPAPSHGTFLLVFRKIDGAWKVVQDAWSSVSGPASW